MVNVAIRVGNIITYPAEIIVNSANKSLMRGSGISGAIHTAAGIELQRECQELKGKKGFESLATGDIIVTDAYNLIHKHVIHTVGPKVTIERLSLLYDCYEKCLIEAERLKAKSISFPAISTNVHGIPLETSAQIVKSVLSNFGQPQFLQEINLFFLKQKQADVYNSVFGG